MKTIDASLQEWRKTQVRTAQRLLPLGEQMEGAFTWSSLDFATADAEMTATWWRASVTFPEDFSRESKWGRER